MKIFIFLITCWPFIIFAQVIDWGPFNNLIDKTWNAEGNWGDGSNFKQSIHFSFDLNQKIIISDATGYTNEQQTEYGNRNHGIRKYDSDKQQFVFWEYDVFGGVTQGDITLEGNDIIYQYQYGQSVVTDIWQYINDSTYQFTAGSYINGEWAQKYLETSFKLEKSILPKLASALQGKWSSPAWDGILEEQWKFVGGILSQTAVYSENGKPLYESQNFIENKGGELILTTVIKDNNPKVFKATEISDEMIVFENSDYANPSKVTYYLKVDQFKRKIEGIEDGAPSEYTFNFARTKMCAPDIFIRSLNKSWREK